MGAITNDNPVKRATPGTQGGNKEWQSREMGNRVHKGAIKNDNPEKRATPGIQGGNKERQSRETGNTGYTRRQ
jgi:hypothetical protein